MMTSDQHGESRDFDCCDLERNLQKIQFVAWKHVHCEELSWLVDELPSAVEEDREVGAVEVL